MVVVAGTIPMKPEQRERAVQVALKMVAATKLEAGCITYDFWSDLADPNVFHVFEEWETGEALEAHFATPHMAEFQDALNDIIAAEPNVKKYEVGAVTPLM